MSDVDLKAIAREWTTDRGYIATFDDDTPLHQYMGALVPKERPRKGAGGQMYTPPKTREFETAVAKWGKQVFTAPVSYPVRLTLILLDATDDAFLLSAGRAQLAFADHGDIDNYEKAICDALNKIAWTDDKKIVEKRTERRYSDYSGFALRVSRAGLAKHELVTLRNLIKMEQAK